MKPRSFYFIQGSKEKQSVIISPIILLYGAWVLNRGDFPEILGTFGILIPQTDEQPFQIQLYGPGAYFWYSYEEEACAEGIGRSF